LGVAQTVIAGAQVADGTGAPLFAADVWLDGRRISRVEPPREAHPAADVVDSVGRVLAPGFIDVHSHADLSPFLTDADTTKVLQGVTTEVTGNCGASLLAGPLGEEARRLVGRAADGVVEGPRDVLFALDRARPVVNQAPLVGHGGIRRQLLGHDSRPPTLVEAAAMRAVLEEALDAGAFGLSSGLFYAPGAYATAEEIADLLRGPWPRPPVYASHIRNEGSGLLEAVAEFLAVGREAAVLLELSHHKAAGIPNWGRTKDSLARIAEARRDGVAVALDAYPYTASSTSLAATLPPWALEGGPERTLARLRDPTTRERIRHDCEAGLADWESIIAETGYERMTVARTPSHRGEGQTLAEIAHRAGRTPFDAAADLLVECGLQATLIVHSMDDADLCRVLADPACWIGSDGTAYRPDGLPHPRLTGTFPRVLGPFVRDRRLFRLEEAVRRMTGGPAAWFGIPDRGQVAEGQIADLVLFDPVTVADRSTFAEPFLPPAGVDTVWLGGSPVVRHGRFVGERLGRRLRPAA
jgi:N-acyl-D-amino-acid deacylase